jgi:amino acid adenylation domain-containing protein
MHKSKPVPVIDKKNIENLYALTPLQEGLLFHYLKESEKRLYLEQLILDISGEIQWELFQEAWNAVTADNEILRTVFLWEHLEHPIQVVLKSHKLQMDFYDCSPGNGIPSEKLPNPFILLGQYELIVPGRVPFGIILGKTGENSYKLTLRYHHILMDGWSMGIILKEFFTHYHDLIRDRKRTKIVKGKFKDYVKWVKNQQQNKSDQEIFWNDYLKGVDTPSILPIKVKPGDRQSRENQVPVGRYSLTLSKEITADLDRQVKSGNTTLAVLLYTAWAILLRKYTDSEDIIFGTTVSGRSIPLEGIENMVGLFINTIPLRVKTSPNQTIQDLGYRITKDLKSREKYESTSLAEIKKYSRLSPREELFDNIVVIENYPLPKDLSQGNSGLTIRSYSMLETTNYDLTAIISVFHGIEINLVYDNRIFTKDSVVRLSGHFRRIILEIAAFPQKEIAGIDILADEEKQELLEVFNQTDAPYPKEKILHQVFAGQVERTPDNIAVVARQLPPSTGSSLSELISITYKELNDRSQRLAGWLKTKGLQPDIIVGIMAERSAEMIMGILGILIAGGVYLPIDPEYPVERINYLLTDSGAKALVTTKNIEGEKILLEEILEVSQSNSYTHTLSPASSAPSAVKNLLPATGHQPPATSLAYILYTSGSTGKPKGVMVEHTAVVNVLYGLQRQYPLTEIDAYLFKTSVVFDVSVTELFGWFFGSGRLVIPGKGGEKDPDEILNAIEQMGITHINFVPSLFNVFVQGLNPQNHHRLARLKYIFLAGEVLLAEVVEKFKDFNKTVVLENIYGPTEGTIYSSKFSLTDWIGTGSIPIGRPLPNIRIYILGKDEHLQSVGVPGELCLGGVGLARGYLNRPELTAEKFQRSVIGHSSLVINYSNFSLNDQWPMTDDRIYRTGDLARWLSDGNIEFLGRFDHQVKIRGFRIELGEIENQLLRHDGVKEAVVVEKEDGVGDKYLAAYIVSEQISLNRLKEYLLEVLPGYMVPSYFMQLDEIPLTPTGKVNRRALPACEISQGERYAAPRDEIEEKLVEIWSLVLGRDVLHTPIGIDDNFFQLGGHSLKATVLISKIHKALNVKVLLAEIFKNPTIRGLSKYIKTKEKEKYVPIEVEEKKEYYRLSSAQKRLYLLHQIDLISTVYNISAAVILEGVLDIARLEATFQGLIHRHESLRTSFDMIGEEPVQRIHDQVEFDIEYHNISEIKVKVKAEEEEGTRGLAPLPIEPATALISSFICPFDLSQASLLRMGLIQLEEETYLLMADMHHIISDGISLRLLIQEFMALMAGESLPALRLQYKDFSQWQNSEPQKKTLISQERYWKRQFHGEIPVLDLPTDYARPAIQRFEGSTVVFEIVQEEVNALQSLALAEGMTLYMILLGIYYILLSKLSNQEDILVGTPTVGRRHADLEQIIGMFVNTLVLRNYPRGEQTYREFFKEIKKRSLEAFENQDYPYEELVEVVAITRDISRNPLFDSMFVLENQGISQIEIPGLKLSPHEHQTGTSKFDLTLIGVKLEEKMRFIFEYSTKLFKRQTIEKYTGYFKKIIADVLIAGPKDIKLSEIEIIRAEEKRQILFDFNDTESEYPKDKTLHRLLEEQVERTPDHTALVGPKLQTKYKSQITNNKQSRALRADVDAFGEIQLSYGSLNEESNHLAYTLIEKDVKSDTIVGIMVERSVEMIIGILGILKAGGAYLPIGPDYPQERIDYMLKDSGAKLLVTTGILVVEGEKERRWEGKKIFLESDCCPGRGEVSSATSHQDVVLASSFAPSASTLTSTSTCQASSANLAYIIYTSGSTGKPKGVTIEHLSVINVLYALHREYPFLKSDVYLFKTPILFDVSVTELFGWFLGGGRLVLLEKGAEKDPQRIIDSIKTYFISHINFVPSMFGAFLAFLKDKRMDAFPSLKYIFIAGEALPSVMVKDFMNMKPGPRVELENIYGPTEGTVYTTSYSLAQWDGRENIPIGRPLNNIKSYIFNNYDGLQPIGLAGELCIGGFGLARGYLNQPQLTDKKFIHHPYLEGERIYRTGDLARWLPERNIEFLGRIDRQVKIRGFRIELGEIENCLLRASGVKEAVVLARVEDGGDKYLCAYFVSDREYGISELREYLSMDLPDYMIPSYFVRLEKIPLTPNGKIDQGALPEPELQVGESYTAPGDEIEEKLVEIWSGVLGIEKEKIGINDNFFHLGGHSLKATILSSRIQQTFNVHLPLGEIFKQPVIRKLSTYIKEASEDSYLIIEVTEKKDYYTLSSAQKRLFFLDRLQGNTTAYNLPAVMRVEGEVDRFKLEQVFEALIRRHESLRTSFRLLDGEPVQVIHEAVEFDLTYMKIGEESIRRTIDGFIQPFNLDRAPLMRVGLVDFGLGQLLLLFDMHHIISDGISEAFLVREFLDVYQGKMLPVLSIQYKDYSQWRNRLLDSDGLKKQEEYWLSRFKGELSPLELPTDYPRPSIQSFEGNRVVFHIDSVLTEKIRTIVSDLNTTLYTGLLAVYYILLSRYTGQEDIFVGVPTAGRNRVDIERIIGLFVNTLPVRNYPRGETPFFSFLEEVKVNVLDAYDHQDYPFDVLVDKLNLPRDYSRNPVFDVLFVSENVDIPELELEGLKFVPYEFEIHTTHLDLVLYTSEVNDKVEMILEYSTVLFERSTAEKMAQRYVEVLQQVVNNKDIRLKDIKISTGLNEVKLKQDFEDFSAFNF